MVCNGMEGTYIPNLHMLALNSFLNITCTLTYFSLIFFQDLYALPSHHHIHFLLMQSLQQLSICFVEGFIKILLYYFIFPPSQSYVQVQLMWVKEVYAQKIKFYLNCYQEFSFFGFRYFFILQLGGTLHIYVKRSIFSFKPLCFVNLYTNLGNSIKTKKPMVFHSYQKDKIKDTC